MQTCAELCHCRASRAGCSQLTSVPPDAQAWPGQCSTALSALPCSATAACPLAQQCTCWSHSCPCCNHPACRPTAGAAAHKRRRSSALHKAPQHLYAVVLLLAFTCTCFSVQAELLLRMLSCSAQGEPKLILKGKIMRWGTGTA